MRTTATFARASGFSPEVLQQKFSTHIAFDYPMQYHYRKRSNDDSQTRYWIGNSHCFASSDSRFISQAGTVLFYCDIGIKSVQAGF